MKNFTILKGFHYSNFFPSIKLLRVNRSLERTFRFDKSCVYDIDEKSCVNKLFGFCFGLFGVHKNSVRFGWTYNKEMNEIFIWKYVYKNGELLKTKIFSCELESEHIYTLKLWKMGTKLYNAYYCVDFFVDGRLLDYEFLSSNKNVLLTLGPYFGGRTRAPHKMIVEEVK